MTPSELEHLTCDEIAERLFGRVPAVADWWALERDDAGLWLKDMRLGLRLRVTLGFLVALHEVSTYQHAADFGLRNRIRVLQDRGIFIRGTAEIAIKCDGVPPLVSVGNEPYKVEFSDGVEVSVAHASFFFQRLVASPSAEVNSALPDPSVITTLVMTGVDIDNATDVAERALYALRDGFPEVKFEFVQLTSQNVLGESLEDVPDRTVTFSTSFATAHPWAIAFYNRAVESEPLSAFLYYYRVLEACFDLVIEHKLNAWREDRSLDATSLLREVRNIARIEDTFALRQVLGQIVDQAMLDTAFTHGIINSASVDELTKQIYIRRNEIAHGRRGQHQKVLVPYSFPFNTSAERDLHWQSIMSSLARRAIDNWLQS